MAVLVSTVGWAQPRIAVTDLAYTDQVSHYFEVGTLKTDSSVNINTNRNNTILGATSKSDSTYVAGTYNYVEQRELGFFSSEIRGAILKGTDFRLVQGKIFDPGEPQLTKAEQVLDQVQTGKVTKPLRQPQIQDIITRINKGEFNDADYVLFGNLTSAEFRDTVTAIQGTTNATHMFGLDLVADFSLISTKTLEIVASFSAQGEGSDTKLHSTRRDVLPPNRGKVIRETSRSMALNVYEQLSEQLRLAKPPVAGQIRDGQPARVESATSQRSLPVRSESAVTTLR